MEEWSAAHLIQDVIRLRLGVKQSIEGETMVKTLAENCVVVKAVRRAARQQKPGIAIKQMHKLSFA